MGLGGSLVFWGLVACAGALAVALVLPRVGR